MKKNFSNLAATPSIKKAAKRIALLAILLGAFIWIYPDEDNSVVIIEPTEISTGVLVTPTPVPSATPVAELKEPVNNQFTGDVEEVYTPLQGSTPSSDGVAIERNEVVGTETFQQSHQGEVAIDQSNQEIGWVENSNLPQQEVVEVKLPEVLPQTPQPTVIPTVEETVGSEPAEPTVQEEQPAPQPSTPEGNDFQEEVQSELMPEIIEDAQPESDIVIDTETGEVSGEVEPQGEDLCGPANGYQDGLFVWDGTKCVLKG